MKVILHSIAVWSYFRIEEAIRLRKAIALALVAVLLFTNITVARAATLEMIRSLLSTNWALLLE